MRARYYNQDIKRFINRDVVSGDITNSQSLNRYCYVQGNPVSLIDPFGLCPTEEERRSIKFKRALSNIVHTSLDAVGLLVPGMGDMLDAVNAIIYALEGDIDMAIISLICTIPIVGSLIGLPIKYAMKYGVDVGMAFMKFGIRNAPEITEGVSRLARAMKSKYDDASAWLSKRFAKFTPDGGRVPDGGSYASPNKIANLLDERPELTGTTRDKLLATVQDAELKKIINELYRPGATVGDGGTAAILVEEYSEGSSKHLIKATERLAQLEKLAGSGRLGLNDLDVAEALMDDLESAISLYN